MPAPTQRPDHSTPQDLCNADAIPDAGYLADADPAADAAALSLARIRQLAAHEVGHALGFEHNFAASTYGRASVMDYPAPLATLSGDRVDLSQAYATSIGKYDELVVRYAYSEFAPGTDETAALTGIVRQGLADHLLYIDDDDGRPLGAGHPLASLWDNGDDAPAMLRQQLAVRRAALDRFGLASLPNGQPLSLLEARLVPLYLHHRFQLQAAHEVDWRAVFHLCRQGAGAAGTHGRPARRAWRRPAAGADRGMETLDPAVLTLPQRILDLIPPPASGYTFGTAELFPRATSPAFDPVSAAVVAADLAISGLLQPARAARLERFHAERAADPGFQEVVTALVNRVWGRGVSSTVATRETGLRGAVIEASSDAGRLAADGSQRENRCGSGRAAHRQRGTAPVVCDPRGPHRRTRGGDARRYRTVPLPSRSAAQEDDTARGAARGTNRMTKGLPLVSCGGGVQRDLDPCGAD